MPDTVVTRSGLAAGTYVQVIQNEAGQYWNGSAYEDGNASNIATYGVMPQTVSALGLETGKYSQDFAGLLDTTAGTKQVRLVARAGASLTTSDLAWVFGEMTEYWDGTQWISNVSAATLGTQAKADVTAAVPTASQNAAAILGTATTGGDTVNQALSRLGDVDSQSLSAATNALTAAAESTSARTNTGTLLARIGSWSGTGVNTILGAFKALLSKTASAPSDIGGTFDPATDSAEALRDRGDAAYLTNTAQQIADALKLAPAGGAPDNGSVMNQLSGLAAAVDEKVTVVVTPLVANVNNPRYATRSLAAIAAGSESQDQWTVVDGTGTAVNLSGKSLLMVVYRTSDVGNDEFSPLDDTITPTFSYCSDDGDLVVSGGSNNIVTLTHDREKTAIWGDYSYWLLNTTDRIPIAQGKLPIKPCSWSPVG